MAKLLLAICDDDHFDLRTEKELICDVLSSKNIETEVDTFASAEALLSSNKRYPIVILDIEMNGINGISTAEALHKRCPGCLIFFVTNHEKYMDEALNKHAFRFWTKPIDPYRLSYGIVSAIREIKNRQSFIKVNVNKKPVSVLCSKIIYAYTENRVCKIITTDEEIVTKDTFKSVKEQLTMDFFCDVHASYCVNMNFIVEYSSTFVLCQCNGTKYKIDMSKRKSSEFQKRFAEWSGGTV